MGCSALAGRLYIMLLTNALLLLSALPQLLLYLLPLLLTSQVQVSDTHWPEQSVESDGAPFASPLLPSNLSVSSQQGKSTPLKNVGQGKRQLQSARGTGCNQCHRQIYTAQHKNSSLRAQCSTAVQHSKSTESTQHSTAQPVTELPGHGA